MKYDSGMFQPCCKRMKHSGGKLHLTIKLSLLCIVLLLQAFRCCDAQPCKNFPFQLSSYFIPKFKWDIQELWQCMDEAPYANTSSCKNQYFEPERVKPPGMYGACTNDPSTMYVCSEEGSGCLCEGSCLNFNTQTLDGSKTKTVTFPPLCQTSILALEDTYTLVGTYFVNGHNPGADFECTADILRAEITASYGSFDVFDTELTCAYKGAKEGGEECEVDNKTVLTLMGYEQLNVYVAIKYFRQSAEPSGTRRVHITGNWQQVNRSMTILKYKPFPNQNTNRLRNYYYNPEASKDPNVPFEVMTIVVFFASPRDPLSTLSMPGSNWGPWYEVGSLTQMIHILDIDDPPNITNPSLTYSVPSECTISEAGKLPTGWKSPACNFGLYYAAEDSVDTVTISGILIRDIDVYERCTYDNPLFPECNQLKVLFKVFKGTMLLNTRSDLNFISGILTDREGFFFTASQSNIDAAVKVIYYNVDLPQLIGKSASSVLNYNTQQQGNEEYITIKVDDQGFCGWTGVYTTTTTQVNMTVVAVNNAPQLQGPNLVQYQAVEDELLLLSSQAQINVSDVDVDEVITSSLAHKEWMNNSRYSQYLNKVQLTASLTYGALKVGYLVAPFVQLVSNDNVTFATVKNLKYGHDNCRVNRLLETPSADHKPYSTVCVKQNQGSLACSTGDEDGCVCQNDGDCILGDDITLSLQKQDSKSEFESNRFLESLAATIDEQDRNCGGMPVFALPNNFSFGKPCANDADCSSLVDESFKGCTLAKATSGFQDASYCRCCVNLSHVCQSDDDCSIFDNGSPCGCVESVSGPGICGPYGLTAEAPRNITHLISFPAGPKYFGKNCRFQGSDAYMCKAPMYVTLGTQLPRFYQSVSIDSPGSRNVSLITDIKTATTLVNSLVFLSAKYWNRLFRIPEKDRNPLTFNIQQDTFDVFNLVVNDLGNSGGGTRQPLSVSKSVEILVLGVNNPPQAITPLSVTATEDVPYFFLKQLQVADPDSFAYGYASRILTINLTSKHGRLFLNEPFLKQPSSAITFIDWGVKEQENRGLHHSPPIYGNGCQQMTQCSDESKDPKFGYFSTAWYGVVYSPLTANGKLQGCGFCPADAGNKFISISGTLTDINEALSEVVYLSDPNFNTRYGIAETITLSVNDNGALGENPSPSLMDSSTVNVIVESVNDSPIVGRRMYTQRIIRDFSSPVNDESIGTLVSDYEFLPINKSIDEKCSLLSPSSIEYAKNCDVKSRQYIDVDEDTPFYITPQYLWISDVDANESLQISQNNRRFCCEQHGPDGCICGGNCQCGTRQCACKVPDVCNADYPGLILIDLYVQNGLLTFSPPPGRETFKVTDLAFLINITDVDFRKGGDMRQCPNQRACSVNVSRLMIRAPILIIQKALQDGYLSYRGKPQYFGPDTLSIWVNDQAYTDECYNTSLTTVQTINIRVVGINDPPVLSVPNEVLVYPSNLRCYVDFATVKTNDEGFVESCRANPGDSAVPPTSSEFGSILVSDDDINAVKYGNMTLYLTIGTDPDSQSSAGTFFLPMVLENSTAWFEQYAINGLSTTVMQGKISEMNSMLSLLTYNGDPTFTGYVPFVIIADDMYNYGECSGDHKCGYLSDVCYDPSLAEPHRPSLRGTSKQIIDVMIGASSACLSDNCEDCNNEAGCGWCPGTCPDKGGSCMSGGSSGPGFEKCPLSRDGRGWRQCSTVPFNLLQLIAAVAGGLGGFGVVFLVFFTWARRRHGSIKAYVFKKGRDFAITARRLNIMPPITANYNQTFIIIALATITIIIVQLPQFRVVEPTCAFQSNFYMDGKTSAIYMTLDNCNVRFVPTPEVSILKAIMLKFAIPSDPQIELEAHTCAPNKTFTLKNRRPDSVKYIGYYCNIEILVPVKNFVIPNMAISASGSNLTTVRTGPPWFELNFGPNSLSLTGNTLNAYVDSIRVKTFKYEVIHGRLVARDLEASKQAIFTSEDADMSVTTTIRTSVRFWQKSGNLVCLTAAPGSLYVNNSCSEVCTLRNSNTSSASSSRRKLKPDPTVLNFTDLKMSSSFDRESMIRVLGETFVTVSGLVVSNPVAGDPRIPYTCTGDPSKDQTWLCTLYDPVAIALEEECPPGTAYAYKKQVPQIQDCTDLQFCVVKESSQCLCKPTCDLDSSLNPPGKCDIIGQCCQTLCAGYSRADLFPTPNQPRCSESGLWCTGALDQQFTFTSTSGQIALQVLPTCTSNVSGTAPVSCGESIHSYQGKDPAYVIPSSASIIPADQAVLRQAFHVGGAPAPRTSWFVIKTSGPGIPDDEFGQLVWVDNVRHFVIPPWLLELFSFNLFLVEKATTSVRFKPGHCPAFISANAGSAFNERLVEVRTAVLNALQAYPTAASSTPIPSRSLLSYIGHDGPPLVFLTDVRTNKVTASTFDITQYAELLAMLGFVIGLPLALSILAVLTMSTLGNQYLLRYRRSVAHKEWASRQFSALLSGKGTLDLVDVPVEVFARAKAKTSFYFIVEDFIGLSSEHSLTVPEQWRAVFYQMFVIILPVVFVHIFADKLYVLYQRNKCQYRFDLCACLDETDGYLQFALTLKLMIYTYFCVSVLELILHILTVDYNIFRRILRSLFYVLVVLMIWLTMTIIFLILVSIVVGFIIAPTAASIYAIAVTGTLATLTSIVIQTLKNQVRVRKNVEALVAKYRIQKAKKLPKQVLDVVIGTHIQKALHESGLNILSICTKVLFATTTNLLVCLFLFIGFSQFTDMKDFYVTLMNNSILSAALFAVHMSFVVEADSEDVKRSSHDLGETIAKTLQGIIDMLARQMEIATGLMQQSGVQIPDMHMTGE